MYKNRFLREVDFSSITENYFHGNSMSLLAEKDDCSPVSRVIDNKTNFIEKESSRESPIIWFVVMRIYSGINSERRGTITEESH